MVKLESELTCEMYSRLSWLGISRVQTVTFLPHPYTSSAEETVRILMGEQF